MTPSSKPTVMASTKNLTETTLDPAKEHAIQETVAAARRYLDTADGGLAYARGPGISVIFMSCFKQDMTTAAVTKVRHVLRQTKAGIEQPHTIKLADSSYVHHKYGAFGGPTGSIHLAKYLFPDAGPAVKLDIRVWTYVHEATHKFAQTVDVGGGGFKFFTDAPSERCYIDRPKAILTGSIKYNGVGVGPEEALYNADSFAAFVVMFQLHQKGMFIPMLP